MGKKKAKAPQDLMLLHSRTEDGQGLRAIRSRTDSLELAELRPLKEGQPLGGGEVVRLHPRKEHPLLCDVEVQYSGRGEEGHAGPSQVATERYRQNWQQIFGGEPDPLEGPDERKNRPFGGRSSGKLVN